jgi:hypothetical protein
MVGIAGGVPALFSLSDGCEWDGEMIMLFLKNFSGSFQDFI